MENFLSVDVFECHAKLNEPLHDLTFSEVLIVFLCLFDLVRKVTHCQVEILLVTN